MKSGSKLENVLILALPMAQTKEQKLNVNG
jgi:hypothetical protein